MFSFLFDCCRFDFDFSSHKCFLHVDDDICGTGAVITAAANAFTNAGRVSVQLCPTGTDP